MPLHEILMALPLLGLFAYTTDNQSNTPFEAHTYTGAEGTLKYRLLKPLGYVPGKRYPLVVFLHGLSERGNDNQVQLRHAAPLLATQSVREQYPAWVLVPQCPTTDYWIMAAPKWPGKPGQAPDLGFLPNAPLQPTLSLVSQLVDEMALRDGVDADRIYMGGVSLGAMGTLDLVPRRKGRFAAAFAIAGGASPATAAGYEANFPLWLLHGANDDIVNPAYSRQLAQAARAQGANVRLTEMSGVNHYSIARTLPAAELLKWLFAQRRSGWAG